MDDPDQRPPATPVSTIGARRPRRRRARAHDAEQPLGERRDVLAAEVAADDERRPRGSRRALVRRGAGRPRSRPSTVSRVPPDGRWYGDAARRSCRRTPRRRGGAGRPAPGAGRSAARRAAARPRRPGTSDGAGPRPPARGPAQPRGGHVDADASWRPSRLRRGATRRAARPPRPGRSRRSARCPRSGRAPRARSRRPGRRARRPRRRRRARRRHERPAGQVGDEDAARWRGRLARPPGTRRAAGVPGVGPLGDHGAVALEARRSCSCRPPRRPPRRLGLDGVVVGRRPSGR